MLKMRARLFLRVIEKARKQYKMLHSMRMVDLCSVATIAGNIDNYKQMFEHFSSRATPAREPKALPLDDENTALIVAAALRAGTPFARGLNG